MRNIFKKKQESHLSKELITVLMDYFDQLSEVKGMYKAEIEEGSEREEHLREQIYNIGTIQSVIMKELVGKD